MSHRSALSVLAARLPRWLLLCALLLTALGAGVRSGVAHAAGSMDSTCTNSSLQADLTAGGVWTLACPQNPQAIAIGTTLTFSSGTDTLQAAPGTQVILDGGHTQTQAGTEILHVSSGTLTLDGLTLQNGSTSGDGGAIDNSGGTLTVTASTFSANTATDTGGAIYNNGTLTVTNSTFSVNHADYWGGAMFNAGALTATNSTLSDNTATEGGAIFNDTGGTLTVTNTLIANNTCYGTITDGGNNLEWQGSPTAGLTCGFALNAQNGVDPGLAAGLADNGGPTQTLAVSSTGAAAGNGNGTVCRTTTGTAPVGGVDQRGYARPASGGCAIGAFEPVPVLQTLTDTTPGCALWTVPAGVTALDVTAIGAAGTGGHSTVGGTGDGVTATLAALVPDSYLDLCVAVGGGAGGGGSFAGGHYPGGDGGGASGLSVGTTFSQPALVAGGGGGGGAGAGLDGGGAGLPDGVSAYNSNAYAGGGGGTASSGGVGSDGAASGSGFTAAGPGAGGAGASLPYYGGGGGGGGYFGGGGGGAGFADQNYYSGAAGGGGSDLCSNGTVGGVTISDCTQLAGAGTQHAAGAATGDAQILLRYPTTTTVTSCTANPVYGQPVSCTAAVSSVDPGTPTGTVTFWADGVTTGTELGSCMLGSGLCTVLPGYGGLSVASHSITAVYSGDGTFAGSTSDPYPLTVTKATPVLTWSSPAPITYGTALGPTQLDATASDPTTQALLDGQFTYTLADGTTAASGAVLPAGANQTLKVSFVPTDSTDYTDASGSTTITVSPASTSTSAQDATATFSAADQQVTLQATVTSPAGTVTEGTVTFTVLQGTTPVGTATTSGTVTNGAASVRYTLPGGTGVGPYTIAAVYNGSAYLATSTDSSHTLTVSQASTTLVVDPASGVYGGTTTLTATLTAGGQGLSGKTISFSLNGTAVSPTATTDASGVAVLTGVSLAGIGAGSYPYSHTSTGVQADFAGDADYAASVGGNTLTVNRLATRLQLAASPATLQVGQTLTVTATISPTSPSIPTGTVVFTLTTSLGTVLTQTASLSSNGQAPATFTGLPPAQRYALQASYLGDVNFLPSSARLPGSITQLGCAVRGEVVQREVGSLSGQARTPTSAGMPNRLVLRLDTTIDVGSLQVTTCSPGGVVQTAQLTGTVQAPSRRSRLDSSRLFPPGTVLTITLTSQGNGAASARLSGSNGRVVRLSMPARSGHRLTIRSVPPQG